jgi:hypothetical protein
VLALVRTTAITMNPATTGGNVWSVGTIGPDGLELGTDASPAGPCKTVSVNRIGAVKRASYLAPTRVVTTLA